MTAPPHHFMQNLNNPQQSGMRSSFGLSPMQTQMTSGSMQNTLPTQMPVPMSNPMGSPMVPQMTNPMNGTMGNQMNPSINGGSPMLNQMNPHYSMNSPMNGTQMAPHQTPTQIPIQQRPMEYAANLNHHEMPQPTPGVAPTPPSVPVQQQQQQQSKEFNTASLCRLGQETVQDIVSRTQEVFQTLKQIQNTMPRRKRGGDLASSAAKRRKQKESRRNETEEEHEARLQNQRTRMSNLRSRRSEERTANKSTEESRILKDNLTKEEFLYEPTKKYYNHKYVVIGKMNNVCQFAMYIYSGQ